MEPEKEQKRTQWLLRICTAVYAILYPIAFQFALVSFMVSDKPNLKAIEFLAVVGSCLSVPIVMLISIWKMWASYVQKRFRRARWYTLLPIGAIALAIIIITAIDRALR